MFVRCGDWDLKVTIEELQPQERRAKKLTIHPEFNSKTLWNDIAVIHLFDDFVLQPHINPVCLPSESYQLRPGYQDKKCWATGHDQKFVKEFVEDELPMKGVPMDLVNDQQSCLNMLKTWQGLGK